jgi:hypothetical protein
MSLTPQQAFAKVYSDRRTWNWRVENGRKPTGALAPEIPGGFRHPLPPRGPAPWLITADAAGLRTQRQGGRTSLPWRPAAKLLRYRIRGGGREFTAWQSEKESPIQDGPGKSQVGLWLVAVQFDKAAPSAPSQMTFSARSCTARKCPRSPMRPQVCRQARAASASSPRAVPYWGLYGFRTTVRCDTVKKPHCGGLPRFPYALLQQSCVLNDYA